MAKRKHLATSDVARICQVTAVTVGNWIRSGKLPASRVPGGNYRIGLKSLAEFLKRAGIALPPSLTKTQPSVLIIEHRPDTLRRITDILTDNNRSWNIDTAADCFTAGAKVVKNEPDLIILDILMPGIDPDVCRQVKKTLAWKRARVIALVDHKRPASLAKAKMLTADRLLSGDFTDRQLRSAIFGLILPDVSPSGSDHPDPPSATQPYLSGPTL